MGFGQVGYDADPFSSGGDGEGWSEDNAGEAAVPPCSYVPIDPCQPVIMAIRAARVERELAELLTQSQKRAADNSEASSQ
jgi:hypothetical protein